MAVNTAARITSSSLIHQKCQTIPIYNLLRRTVSAARVNFGLRHNIPPINCSGLVRQFFQPAILPSIGDSGQQMVAGAAGVTTDAIDVAVHKLCIELGVYPSPLGYRGFPKSVCTSVNNVICHGIPDDRPLHDGDIINIDVTVFQNGYHGDCSRSVLVGNVDDAGQELIAAADACLDAAISVCRDGVPFSAIGAAVEEEACLRGVAVVPAVAGHGIGRQFHEPPDIYHFDGSPYEGVMCTGMTFTVEPAVVEGEEVEIEVLADGWTAVTVDRSRSAQAEHTILVTDDGCEILTLGREW